ncbi:MAG: hypothetical protein R2746_07570 [Acidimicrobiales bacterium]
MSEPFDAERPVPPVPGGQTGPGDHEVALDLAAFLPEGTQLASAHDEPSAPAEAVDPWDTGAPEPEVPAWALDDPSPSPAAPAPEAGEPAVDPVAVAALERIDEELAAVDDALLALDAGAPERSALLRDLLA